MKDWNRHNPIAKFVRNIRKEDKMTQLELSDLTGVGLRFVRDIEQGKLSLMTEKVNQILILFGYSLHPMLLTKEELNSLLDRIS